MLGHYNKFSVQHDVPTLHILHETIIIETLRRFKFIANWTKLPRDQYTIRCGKKTFCVFLIACCNIEGINHNNWRIVSKHSFKFIHILRDSYHTIPKFNIIWLYCKSKFIASDKSLYAINCSLFVDLIGCI